MRFLGIQANASDQRPDRLEGSAALLKSAPEELAAQRAALRRDFLMRIFGGCCGTDDRHIRAMVDAMLPFGIPTL